MNFSQFNFIGKHGHFMHLLSIQSRNNHVIRSCTYVGSIIENKGQKNILTSCPLNKMEIRMLQ